MSHSQTPSHPPHVDTFLYKMYFEFLLVGWGYSQDGRFLNFLSCLISPFQSKLNISIMRFMYTRSESQQKVHFKNSCFRSIKYDQVWGKYPQGSSLRKGKYASRTHTHTHTHTHTLDGGKTFALGHLYLMIERSRREFPF